eukprot:comp65345_c0_seq1/m.47985 comp65345_c0_seq1/g.47985  ORF comp65345_c0_seq1/g.47985 comp65345_c0_seq1/m.47985 type:complete len:352 (-) comp65345_c0_seq1:16-1071(-)
MASPCLDFFLDFSTYEILGSAVFLVVYASYRSLLMDVEAHRQGADGLEELEAGVHTLSMGEAAAFPLIGSASLLFMFYYFESMQLILTMVNTGAAFTGLLWALEPPLTKFRSLQRPVRLPFISVSRALFVAGTISLIVVSWWLLTNAWYLNNLLAGGLCILMLTMLRVPNLQLATLLLAGLVVYDVFWVFYSKDHFGSNVMVHVATKQAENPVKAALESLKLPNLAGAASTHLSMPAKLMFPSTRREHSMSMLGLGDIILPGAVVALVLRWDNSQQAAKTHKYFMLALAGYTLGLVAATMTSRVFGLAQPALLYIGPSLMAPLLLAVHKNGDLKGMWSGSFTVSQSKLCRV